MVEQHLIKLCALIMRRSWDSAEANTFSDLEYDVAGVVKISLGDIHVTQS